MYVYIDARTFIMMYNGYKCTCFHRARCLRDSRIAYASSPSASVGKELSGSGRDEER